MRLIIEPNYEQLSKWAANYVAAKIKKANPTAEKPFVLGLPTGSSPLGMYKNLIELNKQGVISFQNIITFNMDEYVGLPKDHPESYHSFMWNNFFSHIDIKPENVNILNGNAEDLEAECAAYEAKMKAAGGVDLFLGGIGPDGHNDVNKVPKTSVTVGVATVLDAKEVLIMVNGHNKARALQQAVEGAVNQMWTITALQMHPKGIIVADEAACAELKVGTYNYFKDIEKDNLCPCSLLK